MMQQAHHQMVNPISGIRPGGQIIGDLPAADVPELAHIMDRLNRLVETLSGIAARTEIVADRVMGGTNTGPEAPGIGVNNVNGAVGEIHRIINMAFDQADRIDGPLSRLSQL